MAINKAQWPKIRARTYRWQDKSGAVKYFVLNLMVISGLTLCRGGYRLESKKVLSVGNGEWERMKRPENHAMDI